MARKKNKPSSMPDTGAGPKGRRVDHSIDQRSPTDQATGGYDPEDYHGSGPILVGHAPVHGEEPGASGIPVGVDLDENPEGNPGDVPNTESPGAGISRKAFGDRERPDEAIKRASRKAT
ncbi:MAG: hypothetical protein A4E19_13960 [Nitrospira sp. SG-bin1]|nr:MAG: hypothetical protein A4E19_13960 [Nitrospira sp. SG-bin1]